MISTLAPWFERKENETRLVAEFEAMAARFPQFKLHRERNSLFWLGELRSNQGRIYKLKVSYPDGFPQDFPKVYVVSPKLKPNRHTWAENNPQSFMCLFRPESGSHQHSYDPARTTAAAIVAWGAHWIACYEIFEREGWWPGSTKHPQRSLWS